MKLQISLQHPNMKYEFDPDAYESYENAKEYDPIAYGWIKGKVKNML